MANVKIYAHHCVKLSLKDIFKLLRKNYLRVNFWVELDKSNNILRSDSDNEILPGNVSEKHMATKTHIIDFFDAVKNSK